MNQNTIAFATYNQQPKLTSDDELAIQPLHNLGITVKALPWNTSDYDWSQFKSVIIRSTWDYHAHIKEFKEWLLMLQKQGIQVLNSLSIIEWNQNKTYLKELEANQLPTVPTTWVSKDENFDFVEFINHSNHKEFIIKPSISNAANETFRFKKSQAQEHLQHFERIHSTNTVMIQPFIEEVLTSGEVSLIFFNHEYSHAVLNKPKSGDFRVQFIHGGSIEEFKPSESVIDLAKRALNLIPEQSLYARVDLLIQQNNLMFSEIEVIEPCLFLQYSKQSPQLFAKAIQNRINTPSM